MFVPISDIIDMGWMGPFSWPATMTVDLRNNAETRPSTDQMALKYETPGYSMLGKIVSGPRQKTAARRYESTDNGRSWFVPDSTTGTIITKGYLVDYWEVPIDSEGYGEGNFRSIDLSLLLEDGTPNIEVIDGVATRHIFADVVNMRGARNFFGWFADHAVNTLDFWVSTDTAPTVRQMRAKGRVYATKEKTGVVSFEATWKWSRFNEDFGEVKAPPTETLKSP